MLVLFTDINLEFYVDSEYKSLKFFEHWILNLLQTVLVKINQEKIIIIEWNIQMIIKHIKQR